jgi:hypothetical protein
MKPPLRPPASQPGGFSLLEAVVGLGMIAILLVAVVGTAHHTGEHIGKTSGKLAAADKLHAVQRSLGPDLTALADSPDALRCQGSELNCRIDLLVNDPLHGRIRVRYEWDHQSGNLTRTLPDQPADGDTRALPPIATGLKSFDLRWCADAADLESAAGDDAPRTWSSSKPPVAAFLRSGIQAKREEGKRDDIKMNRGARISHLRLILPVGGGTAS